MDIKSTLSTQYGQCSYCVPPQITETILKIAKKGSRDVKDVSFQLIHKVAHQVSLPLSHIFNLSVSNGVFPDSFKISKVVPIFKAGSPQDPGNYRGIALVDAFSKIFEKLVADRLVKFLVKEKFYYAHQYGSIKGRSTGQAVLQVCNYVSRAINEAEVVLAVFLDIQKVFDTVDHKISFEKLEHAGVRGVSLA